MTITQTRIYSILLLLIFLLPLSAQEKHGNTKTPSNITGKIIDAANNEPVSFAQIYIEEHNISTQCNIDGVFTLYNLPEGELKLQVRCLGYNPQNVLVSAGTQKIYIIKLEISSIALPEFSVMAKKKQREKLVIGQSAIEYVQPTSLADILLLLPGNVYKENTMSGFTQITSRQAGSDANTSLGVGVMTDGAPVTNDAMRTQLVGVTLNSTTSRTDTEISSRTGMNQGADMRYLSTDHIESVEFTRGISSARYGNLSSGTIEIQSKYGVSPLRVRMKTDLKNKLAYAGKGFKISEKAGTLHIGADYLYSINDVREEMDKFSRFTAQAYYNNQIKLGESKLDIDAKLSQTLSLNKTRTDELVTEYDESYKANYSKTAFLLKTNLSLNRSWLEKLEFLFSSDVVFDKINRHKMVLSSSGPLNVPLAKEEGEHEGLFLPGKYYSDFYIENIPINLFTQLNAVSRFNLNSKLNTNIFYGLEYRRSKNKGDGAVIIDETRPPFPYDNSYMRPRPNYQIPAISVGAAYLQTELLYNVEQHMFKFTLGGRLTKMFNLPGDYLLADRWIAEPRLNAFYTLSTNVGEKTMKNTLRIGYGEENKLPTLDYLYPEKLYKDFYMLNAYNTHEAYRRLITYTHIFDIANKDLKENKNRKFEVGWDIEYDDFELSLTAFYEETKTGFDYFKYYYPLTYDLYSTLKEGTSIVDRKPEKSDYIKEEFSLFTTASKVMNSKKTIKKGIEYRIIFPNIDVLYTRIEVNGAWYKTNYGSSLENYYYPDKLIAGNVYPYVGIYDTDPQQEYRRFNTNIWFNTHIPKFKLMFTNFFQFVWISSDQYKDKHQEFPYAYVDFKGNVQTVTPELMQKINSEDPVYRYLKRTITPLKYACNSEPVSILWNIKATKEINKYARLSFFVNNIIDINPKYISGDLKTDRKWTNPYFGIELFLNF